MFHAPTKQYFAKVFVHYMTMYKPVNNKMTANNTSYKSRYKKYAQDAH